MPRKYDYIVVNAETKSLECKRCGGKQRIPLPVSIPMLLVMMKHFKKEHKTCPE